MTAEARPDAQQTKRVAFHVVWGIVVAALALWGFLFLADEVPEKSALVRADIALAAHVERTSTEPGEAIFSVISLLGAPLLVALVVITAIVLFRRHHRRRAVTLLCVSGGGVLVNYALKTLFHRTRPEFASEFVHSPLSWSFPSGHSMSSVIGYGFLLYLLLEITHQPWRRKLYIAGTCVLVLLIGFSRVYLGVHYLSDVIGGFLAGTVWLAASIAADRTLEHRRVISKT